ncbi:MAG: sigma-70 family RNA polymerase sigma factor [Polyangiaceae bacterium]|nr:sigma-70 family RNA polymerase sigma factor [Polyangiaceae bacterium]
MSDSRPLSTISHIVPAPDYSSAGEEVLLRGMLADDARAWREFNVRYSRLIYSCISKIVHRFRGVVSEDDISEVYATFCVQILANDKHKLRSFDATRGNKLGSWLGMLANHAAYDFLRSIRREPKRSELTEAMHVCCERPDPCEVAVWRRQAADVTALLSGFSDKDREFILLYFGEGLSPEAVAEKMGINIKTVYSKKHKIRGRLEGLLAEQQMAA